MNMNVSTNHEIREKIKMQLITTENDAVDELDDEIDTYSSIHDSFINMTHNDEELRADVGLNLTESLDLTPPSPSSICSTFDSEFKDVDIDYKSKEFEKILWKKGSLQFNQNQVRFGGDSSLPESLSELKTPFQIWCYLFPHSLEKQIVIETGKYAAIHPAFDFNVDDLPKFNGILFYMTYYKLPNTRDYWSANESRLVKVIQNQMNMQRFEKIREFLHFNDNK